jgi:hypothetical protein
MMCFAYTDLGMLSTVGGDSLTLTGTKFGSQCNFNTLTVGSTVLSMTFCNESIIVATIPPGAGVLGRIALTVGLLTAIAGEGASVLVAYAPPTIVGLAGDSLLPTLGAASVNGVLVYSNVTLLGSNFGPAGTPFVVSFTSDVDGTVRVAPYCTRDPIGHAWVTCEGVEGVGTMHRWAVNVSGQASAPSSQTTSFLAPQLVGVYGPGGLNANTDGGQVVFISGSNFGPASVDVGGVNDALISTVYGPPSDPARYVASGCTVRTALFSGSVLSCITQAGTGGDLFWTVTVANQTSVVPVGPTAYGWPVVASFQGVAASAGLTEGLETVMIFGSNFGPVGTAVVATYIAPKGVVSVLVDPLAPPVPGITNATEVPSRTVFNASDCVVVDAHRQVNCTTMPGAGSNLVWRLTVDGLTSQSPVTSYAAPTLSQLSMVLVQDGDALVSPANDIASLGQLSTEGGELLRISGANFGPAVPASYVDRVWYAVDDLQFDMVNCSLQEPHAVLLCSTAEGVGVGLRLHVSVLGQSTPPSVQTLSYQAPRIDSTVPTALPTQGGFLFLHGFNFGNNPGGTQVVVDGEVLTQVAFVTPHRAVRVLVPEELLRGVASVRATMVAGGQVSNEVVLTVAPPQVLIVDVYDTLLMTEEEKAADACLLLVTDKTQQAVVVLEGENFGSESSSVSILLTARSDGSSVPCDLCHLTHTLLRCVAPASRVLQYDVVVTVVGQASAPVVYDYSEIIKPPSFFDVSPLSGPTEGGTLLTLLGSNFKDRGTVELVSGETTLVCATPPFGEVGDINDVYYARDGRTIKVCVWLGGR